ncbi:hypothetical protein ACWEVP_01160 [Amycolatopsis sp. NPDC003865]
MHDGFLRKDKSGNLEEKYATHGPDHPLTLSAKIILAHALVAANRHDGRVEVAVAIAEDSRDGLEESAVRFPGSVEPHVLAVAEKVHNWILELQCEEVTY